MEGHKNLVYYRNAFIELLKRAEEDCGCPLDVAVWSEMGPALYLGNGQPKAIYHCLIKTTENE